MTVATNCLRVRLSAAALYGAPTEAMCLLAIRNDLESFGEIAQAGIQTVNDWQKVIQAVYYDTRSAKAAKEYFGSFCDFGPQEGVLSLTAPKAVLQALESSTIANVRCTASGEFELEFFDTRVAAQATEMAALRAASVGELTAITTCDSLGAVEDELRGEDVEDDAEEPMSVACARIESPSAGGGSGPCHISGLRMTQIRWEDFTSHREWRTALLLRGLPRSLCQPGQIEALLEAHGLRDALLSVRLPKSLSRMSLGHAIVTATSIEQAPRLAKFFHGKQFGNSMPVAVSFAPNQIGSVGGKRSSVARVCSSDVARSKDLGAPRRISLSKSRRECVDSSESTSPDSPRGSESLQSDDGAGLEETCSGFTAPPGLMLPPGLTPPPGLTLPSSAANPLAGSLAALEA